MECCHCTYDRASCNSHTGELAGSCTSPGQGGSWRAHRLDRAYLFFFFQAEDGIRDLTVTGVQTCALPIFLRMRKLLRVSESFFPKKESTKAQWPPTAKR